ncbi:hypothetical protein FBU30_003368 [Linnemannia zychae]|nr:hypothetical protein FBU30_003368 [Linnemannia zychae]
MSFQQSCDNITLKDKHILVARPKTNGIFQKVYDYFWGVDVTLDLNEKIGNNDGNFVSSYGVNYSYSAENVSIRTEGSKVVLKADLYPINGPLVACELDIAPLIKFENGKLQWV